MTGNKSCGSSRRPIQRRLCIGVAAGVLLLSLSGCGKGVSVEDVIYQGDIGVGDIQYQTTEVFKGDVQQEERVHLRVPKFEQVLYNGNMEGEVSKVYVHGSGSVKKGDKLYELKTEELDNEIEQQGYALQQLQLQYQQAQESGASAIELQQAQLDIQLMENEITKLKQTRQEYVVTAPCDGSVEMGVTEGQYLYARGWVGVIRYERPEFVEIDSSANVNFGKRVNVDDSGVTVGATVVQAENTHPGGDAIMLKLDQPLENPNAAVVSFTTKVSTNVLVVDKNAVYDLSEDGSTGYVDLLNNGNKIKRQVTIGAKSERLYEVEYGLKEGDVVVTNQLI